MGTPTDRQEREPRRSSPRVAVVAVLVSLALGALLNGSGLVTAATGLDVGAPRTIAIRLATAIEATGTMLRLDGPGRWLTEVRDAGLQALGEPTTGSDRATSANGSGPPAEQESVAEDRSRTTESPTRDHDRTRRPVSPDQPLEVLLAGDSLIGAIADGFGRVTDGNGAVHWTKDVRISTGLARPDVLDWHRHLETLLVDHDPDVVVLMLGGNDDQSLTGGPAGVIHLGQDAWEAEYERRLADLLAIAGADDRLVVWLGLPAMRPDRLERTRPLLRSAAERASVDTEVVLLDTEPLVSPGGYTSRLDGVRVRAEDGVHLTHPGGDRVAEALLGVLQDHYGLPAG